MEAIKNWFQDWSDACEYANECVPDLSFAAPSEPYAALASIAAVCFLIWWRNERAAARTQSLENRAATEDELPAAPYYDELKSALDHARAMTAAPEQKAA